MTDKGVNLFSIGKTPDERLRFYLFLTAVIKAVLYKEITDIDVFDPLADAIVAFNWQRVHLLNHLPDLEGSQNKSSFFRKFDSSTGYGQIFSRVAIEAILFARSRGIPVDVGITGELSPVRPEDLRRVWLHLNCEPVFNLKCSALNLLHAAFQMTGRVDFGQYTEEELKLIFTRYNGNVKQISAYGEKAYRYYLNYL